MASDKKSLVIKRAVLKRKITGLFSKHPKKPTVQDYETLESLVNAHLSEIKDYDEKICEAIAEDEDEIELSEELASEVDAQTDYLREVTANLNALKIVNDTECHEMLGFNVDNFRSISMLVTSASRFSDKTFMITSVR